MGCCRRNKKILPSLPTQIKNFVLSTTNVIAYARTSGKIRAEATVVGARIELCQTCRFLQKENNRCTVCGCFIALKAGLIAESCPLKKW